MTPPPPPAIGFNGNMVIPKGMIRLPMQTGAKVVKVEFIVVDAYSLYTAILARSWVHVIGVVSSTLHIKVKYPTEGKLESW